MRGERDAKACPDERGSASGALPARAADYRLLMPVELWFGEHRIGVRPGTPTCAAFQRFANALLAELKAARDRTSR